MNIIVTTSVVMSAIDAVRPTNGTCDSAGGMSATVEGCAVEALAPLKLANAGVGTARAGKRHIAKAGATSMQVALRD